MKCRIKVTYSADNVVPLLDDRIKTHLDFLKAMFFDEIEFTGSGYDLVRNERDLFFDLHVNPKDVGIND